MRLPYRLQKISAWPCLILWVILALVVFLIPVEWDAKVMASCIFYVVLVSLFLGAQIVGFLWSHTHYSEEVESPKFKLLEWEEAEWSGS